MLNPSRHRRSVLAVALCAAVVSGGLGVPTATAASTSDDYWSQRDARDQSMDEWEQQLKKRREALRSGGGSSSGSSGSSSPSSSGSSGRSDDSGDDGDSGKSSTGATKTSDTVVLLGDSTSVDPVASDLEEALKKKGYKKAVIDAVGGSSLIEETKGKSGLARLEALVEKYPDADFIIAMGVNDAANISTGQNKVFADERIEKVMGVTKDVKSVRWLEVDFGDQPSDGNKDLVDDKVHKASDDFNKALSEEEKKHDNLTLIPWDVDDDMFSDGIHYTSEGYKKRVAAIADSTTEGDDNEGAEDAEGSEGTAASGEDKGDDQSGSNSVDWDKLHKAVASIADGSTADIGVTISPATSGSGISASASGEKMYSASTIKIPIAIAVQKNLKPDDTAEITENVGGSGSKQPGTYKVSELLEGMITESDNSATNALITKLGGYDKVNEIIKKITGKNDVKLSNMMMDGTNTSTVTAEGLTKILQRLWADSKDKSGDDKVLDKDKAQKIIDHMYNQTNRIKLPSKIDDDKAVANKTGENTGISHDIGFITNGGKTVAVAVTGKGNADEINAAIGDIGRVIYDWLG